MRDSEEMRHAYAQIRAHEGEERANGRCKACLAAKRLLFDVALRETNERYGDMLKRLARGPSARPK
jgi:hypothetical protein